jgi:hypothetical protein
MAFNIYSYIMHAKRFPFLGTLSRPFLKFCINNFIIPLAFIITYIFCSSAFLSSVELKSSGEIVWYMLAFLGGNLTFVILAVGYFFPTNKNIFKITGHSAEQLDRVINQRKSGLRRKSAFGYQARSSNWRVDTYLRNPLDINLARDTRHYDSETLRKVFYQNHVNASFFELMVVAVFVVVGAFQFNDALIIPAAASACLVFTVVLMFISILMSWLKGWTLSVLIVLILGLNWASAHWDFLNMASYVYGIDYNEPPVKYNAATIDSLNSDLKTVKNDISTHEKTLNTWLRKQQRNKKDPSYKPKIIVANTSGGGLRSSLWTMRVLQYCDSIFNGEVFENTRLLTGSSGGTVGAAYYRELHLRRDSLKYPINQQHYLNNISQDILNRVLYTFATNDIFIRFRTREIAGHDYILDRGMTFEDQLNHNTGFVLNKPIGAYQNPVYRAEIPMMILAPSIVNDGRRMLISSQPISYMSYDYKDLKDRLNLSYENIGFRRMFANHDPDNLLMSSALRMNSTFPYILPYPSLPTEPSIEVMDAGLRDNFGMKISAQYLYTFKDWIEENTSGVIVLQIRDTEKMAETEIDNNTVLSKIMSPIGSFYGNYFNDQDFNMDQLLKFTAASMDVPVHSVAFELRNNPGEHIALSWHLTELEKLKVINSIGLPWNQRALHKLDSLMGE